MNTGEIIIFQDASGGPAIEVKLEQETLWLRQDQIAALFERDRSVITKHISQVFKSGELGRESNVQKMHIPNSDKPVEFYNLEVIISVGYRVNSKRGTQFRQWATRLLKEYLEKGYAIDQQKLGEAKARKRIQEEIQFLLSLKDQGELPEKETRGLAELIHLYTQSMLLLNRFDEGALPDQAGKANEYVLNEEDCQAVVTELRAKLMRTGQASNLFGHEKNKNFSAIVGAVNQTVFGQDAYPSVEAKAAHLLYFIIKNHPFSDGNKRIGAFLFVWYLEKNRHLLKGSGEAKINDNALVALALLVAQSDPKDKDMMIRLIGHLVA